MSSSTVTNPYITESWIHMQHHEFIENMEHKIKSQQLQQQQQQQQPEGKYARSTASSRSRALLNKQQENETDSGMSQTGIYEAFAEADKWEKKPTAIATRKYNDTRRKSTTAVEVKKAATRTTESPRLKTTTTTHSSSSSKLYTARRQTLSGALNSNTVKDERRNHVNNNNGGLVKLADTLRDTLAAERRLAKQELSTYNNNTATRTSQQTADIINNAKRRSSVTKEKLRTLEQPRRRTLSSGAAMLTQAQKPNEASYMKPTLADQQRRVSVTLSPISNNLRVSSASPRRKNSILSKGGESSPTLTSEDEMGTRKASSALKRRSILAAATAKARQQQQVSDIDTSLNSSSGDEKVHNSTNIIKPGRLRKKSLGAQSPLDTDSLLSSRRMSRTESLKEGVPTSPSILAARMARRKSVIKQESPSKRYSAVIVDDEPPKRPTVRKRGKVKHTCRMN